MLDPELMQFITELEDRFGAGKGELDYIYHALAATGVGPALKYLKAALDSPSLRDEFLSRFKEQIKGKSFDLSVYTEVEDLASSSRKGISSLHRPAYPSHSCTLSRYCVELHLFGAAFTRL